MRAIVTGMIATSPVAGVAWDYGQYALGLEQLGFEVYYLEDPGIPSYSFDEEAGEYVEDPTYGVAFLERALHALSPALGRRWHYRSVDGRSFGLAQEEIAEVAASADVLINVSGGTVLREDYRRCPRCVLIDTDPGWNHFVIFPRWDSKPAAERVRGFRAHDRFFTYAARIREPDCPLPDFGLDWKPTRPPVVLDRWSPRAPATHWTTVMTWDNYRQAVEHDGRTYGSKELEFGAIEDLPDRSGEPLEVSINMNGGPPVERWRELGWSVVDAEPMSRSIESYRSYLEHSRGELSVAKQVYVATRCGWFSCRSVCYLAAGRPVVVQETGFSELIETGEGLLAFTGVDAAARAIAAVEDDYVRHRRAARQLAREQFDSGAVLGELLTRAGIG